MRVIHFLLVSLTFAGSAAGAEPPALTELLNGANRPARALPQGGVLTIKGRGLHTCPPLERDAKGSVKIKQVVCRHPGLKVTISGRRALIIGRCTVIPPGNQVGVRVVIPGRTPVGRARKIQVWVEGLCLEAHVEVMTPEAFLRSPHARAFGLGEERGPVPEPSSKPTPPKRVEVTELTALTGQAGHRFQAAGLADLPSGFTLRVELLYEGDPVRAQTVSVAAGRWQAAFGPYAQARPVGEYRLRAIFSVNKQGRAGFRWIRKQPRSTQPAYKRLVRERSLSLGGSGPGGRVLPADREPQRKALRAHVEAFTRAAKTLMQEYARAYASASRCFFKVPGRRSFRVMRYLAYLKSQRLAKSDLEAEGIKLDTRFGGPQGRFRPQAWTRWSLARFHPALRALERERTRFLKRFLCAPDPGAARLTEALVATLAQHHVLWSKALFRAARVPLPKALSKPILSLPALLDPELSRHTFQLKRRRLRAQVELPRD